MRARIRLAVFYYLHHLMSETKISRELFSEAAYKIARDERKLFSMLVDGLMRLELKENAAEIDVVSVIKTRQAVRMMSYQFGTMLNSLKTEGLMPAVSKDKWDEVVADIRESADRILWTPTLSFRDWLESVEWIRPLLESSRHKVVDILSRALCSSEGEFLAERNILKCGWNGHCFPLMWTRRRYETTTYCELVEISAEIIEQVVKAEPTIYAIISNNVQAERLMVELRHTRTREENVVPNFWTTFQSRGKSFTGPEKLTVPEGRIGIVG
ncbi:hypothetical protein KIN20_035013 [Parelaphostrongylus tenuis]|uniref:Uncharacterized protein n=1 Tax=Parelaphostrongylus tenuis TaxID=148309 RepID=A0AAD5RB23_PARTN|nr:hypothetical protein KIN20_035013 [Parelaphostrongylus tenuis]